MNGTGDTVDAETAAQGRLSTVAHWAMVGASLIHDAAAHYITAQTKELAAQLAQARADLREHLAVAYAAGQSDERGELVAMMPDDVVLDRVSEYARAALDHDERERRGANGDEHQGDNPGEVLAFREWLPGDERRGAEDLNGDEGQGDNPAADRAEDLAEKGM